MLDTNEAIALLNRFHQRGITWIIVRVAEGGGIKAGYQVSLSWPNANTVYSGTCDTLAEAVVDVVAQMAGRDSAKASRKDFGSTTRSGMGAFTSTWADFASWDG